MGRILKRLKRLRIRSLNRGDYGVEGSVENADAEAAASARHGLDPHGVSPGAAYPPGYVKPDDGRPRH